jgi:hypothetical protein
MGKNPVTLIRLPVLLRRFLGHVNRLRSFNRCCAWRDSEVWQNLFSRQSGFHLIKLPETIALHAYATII